jgi:hypothetical protein
MPFFVHFGEDREIVSLAGTPSTELLSAEVTEQFALDLINCKTKTTDFIMGFSPRLKRYVPLDKALAQMIGAPIRSFKIDPTDEHNPITEVCITITENEISLDLSGLEETDEIRAYLSKSGFVLSFYLVALHDTRRLLGSFSVDFNRAFSDKITRFKVDTIGEVSVVTRKIFKSYSLVVQNGIVL